jgi:hypothetical protein
MRRAMQWVVRKSAETAPKIVSQVTVSVAATLCTAILTNAFIASSPTPSAAEAPAPVPAAAAVSIDPRSGLDLLKASFNGEGLRQRPTHSMEFGAVFGPSAEAAIVVAGPVEWSTPLDAEPAAAAEPVLANPAAADPVVAEPARPEPAPAEPQATEPRKPSPAPSCGEPCRTRTASAAQVLPPPRPAVVEAAADTARDEDRTLLGLTIPSFVPSGQAIVRSVGSLGDTVGSLVGMR